MSKQIDSAHNSISDNNQNTNHHSSDQQDPITNVIAMSHINILWRSNLTFDGRQAIRMLDECMKRERNGLHRIDPCYFTAVVPSRLQQRKPVVKWILHVLTAFDQSVDTLYHAVQLMDRYLSCKPTSTEKVQRIGLACLFISSKLLEQRPISTINIRQQFNKIIEVRHLFHLEVEICDTLQWDLHSFTTVTILGLLWSILNIQKKFLRIYDTTRLILREALLDSSSLRFPISSLAAGALSYSLKCLEMSDLDTRLMCIWDEFLIPEPLDLFTYIHHIAPKKISPRNQAENVVSSNPVNDSDHKEEVSVVNHSKRHYCSDKRTIDQCNDPHDNDDIECIESAKAQCITPECAMYNEPCRESLDTPHGYSNSTVQGA